MKIPRRANVWRFFAAVYAVSALLYLPVLISGKGMSTPFNTALVALTACVPSGLGILFTSLTKGPGERRDFWRRAFRWPRGRTKVALAGMLILPVNVVASFWLSSILSGSAASFAYAARVLTDWKTLLVFLTVELTFGALSEELGWRGYALDELQSRWSALTSSLVLGLIWALWHTPAFLIPGLSQHEMGGVFSWTYVCFLVGVTLGSIIHTWAYNNTGRSILVAGFLMHFTQNAAMIFLGGIFEEFTMPPAYWPALAAVTAVVSVILLLAYGPYTLNRRLSFDPRRV